MTAAPRQRLGLRTRAAAIAAGLLATQAALSPQDSAHTSPAAPYTTWREYGGARDSMQYSALAQIDRSNVTQLQRAWFYPVPGDPIRLAFNPLVVGDVMYVAGRNRTVVALDAATGAERWIAADGGATERGIAYWESADRSDRRLILTTRTGLREIDARTGQPIASFGVNGAVDMTQGSPRRLGGPNKSPGRLFEDLIIVGSNTGEGYGSPPGDLRAYDVRTGRLAWTFHTSANTWGDITVDTKHGLVFVPTGSPTHDLYGADRAGQNLFGNCLIALDARTGTRRWHFQVVHHDLWDYDLAAAPILLTVRHPTLQGGQPIDIVAQAGKTGFLYVFERLTGKPLWPIEERPVPQSEVPGERASATQPFPTKPPPFARQRFRPEDVNPFVSAEEQEQLRRAVRDAANEGLFTPSSHLRHHIQFPGAWGGANWGSVAGDPATGMLYVRSLEMPSYRRMSANNASRGPTAGTTAGTAAGTATAAATETATGAAGAAAATAAQGTPAREATGAATPEPAGLAVYRQLCAACHGPGQTPMRSPARLGADGFIALLRQGKEQMPAFPEPLLPADRVQALEAYLRSLPEIDNEQGADDPPLRLPPNPGRYAGPPVRYSGSFSAGWYTSNGLPAIGPPWTQLVAYDLNDGTIKWRVPDGTSPGLAAQGITHTGSVRPRNGPVVTAGGLVFIANAQDRMLRAYDKDTGAVLWAHELDANPEGIPAIYALGGRQYIAFAAGASWGTGADPVWRNAFHRKPGKIEAQGYHVFALPLPQRASSPR